MLRFMPKQDGSGVWFLISGTSFVASVLGPRNYRFGFHEKAHSYNNNNMASDSVEEGGRQTRLMPGSKA